MTDTLHRGRLTIIYGGHLRTRFFCLRDTVFVRNSDGFLNRYMYPDG